MIIEIRKAGFVNKGAELMVHAILQKLSHAYPDAILVMAPTTDSGSAPYRKRALLGLRQKAWFWKYGIQWGGLAALVPKKLREAYGVVLDKEVDVVLDASGFSYGDQWSEETSLELAHSSNRWRKQNTKLVLLPQALGPFTSERMKKHLRIFSENASLIFPRERISYDYLTSIVGEQNKIKQYPDFTNLLDGIPPVGEGAIVNRFCIIPNYRMVDSTPREQSDAYLPFLISCVNLLRDKHTNPFILVHENNNDLDFAENLASAVGGLPIIKETDPLRIKGILGLCSGTIGSRYHGLISALSQGVPSLGTSWSHKYQALFEDYGFAEGLLSVNSDKELIEQKIDLITSSESRARVVATIKEQSARLKSLSEQMWQEVFSLLDK